MAQEALPLARKAARADPILNYIAEGSDVFQKTVLDPLGRILEDTADIHTSVTLQPSASCQEAASNVAEKITKLKDAIWETRANAMKYKRRVVTLARRLSKRVAEDERGGPAPAGKAKGKARQAAGQLKAHSLEPGTAIAPRRSRH